MTLIVNGERIDEQAIEQEFAQIKASYEALDPMIQCCERDPEFRGYAEENVVGRVLLTQRALETTEAPGESQVDEALAELKQQYGGEERFFSTFQITAEQEHLVRHDVALNLRLSRMLEAELGPAPSPGEDELRGFYEQHIDQFMNPEKVRASHILKTPKKAEQRQEMYDLMREVREKLLEGADFAELARRHSDRANPGAPGEDDDAKEDAGDGIDLGYFEVGELMEEFSRVAFSMRVGEISPVFCTPFGFHLLTVTGRVPATPRPFEEVREDVEQQYLEEDRQRQVQELVKKLRSEASIERDEEDDGGDGDGDER